DLKASVIENLHRMPRRRPDGCLTSSPGYSVARAGGSAGTTFNNAKRRGSRTEKLVDRRPVNYIGKAVLRKRAALALDSAAKVGWSRPSARSLMVSARPYRAHH